MIFILYIIILQFLFYLFYACGYFACMYICAVQVNLVQCRPAEGAGCPRTELHMFVSCNVHARNQICVLLKSSL